ncbi:Glycoside hydrolase, family 31 [Pelomyxa schiedti]|nr:Glycoside hydrolase, family 31 [Pelomyxa schiedti]
MTGVVNVAGIVWWLLVMGVVQCGKSYGDGSVVAGNARFSAYTSRLVRMEWSATAQFDDRPTVTFINRDVGPPSDLQWHISDSVLYLSTSYIKLIYHMNNTAPFTAESLQVVISYDSKTETWVPGKKDKENLKGSVMTMDCYEANPDDCIFIYYSRLQPGLLSTAGWVIVDDSTDAALTGPSDWPWRVERPETDSYTDWYMFGHGHDYKQALLDFTLVAGKVGFLPAHAQGIWWSRWHAYDEEEVKELVQDYQDHDLPLHVFVLDMDWHIEPTDIGCKPWGGYTWNTTLFPDPDEFQDWTGQQPYPDLKLVLNVHDQEGVNRCQEMFEEVQQAMGASGFVPCNFQNETFTDTMYSYCYGESPGVDYWWTDYCQFDKNNRGDYHCLHDTGDSPLLWSNYVHVEYINKKLGKRGLALAPYGGLGNHRYPQTGSGDTNSIWGVLAFEIFQTLTAANVLTGWTSDLGGFYGEGVSQWEIYLRWVQWGVYSPSFRTHCCGCEREIWLYPNYDLFQASFQLRSALFPYIYSEAWQTLTTGVINQHPLYYDWPENTESYTEHQQYLFGSVFMVHPIYTPADPLTNLTIPRDTWIPPGDWVEWSTGELFTGPMWRTQLAYTFADVPVYARAGSIVPMRSLEESHAVAPQNLILHIVPGQSGSFQIFEDDGDTWAFQNSGEFYLCNVSQSTTATATTVTISPCSDGNGFSGQPSSRTYTINLRGSTSLPQDAECNGMAPHSVTLITEPPRDISILQIECGTYDYCASVSLVVTW